MRGGVVRETISIKKVLKSWQAFIPDPVRGYLDQGYPDWGFPNKGYPERGYLDRGVTQSGRYPDWGSKTKDTI